MNDMLQEFADFLIANGIGTAVKTDIFFKRPIDPVQVIVLAEYSGLPPQRFVISMDRKIQISARGKTSYAKGMVDEIYKLIVEQTKTIIYLTGGERFAIMLPLDTPHEIIETQEDGTSIYGFNLSITTQSD